tara:strand:+ start:127 stop:753 length:627 start_codon:yes stop_codon:yes gene_type:complete
MRGIILLLIFPIIVSAQFTFIADTVFEQALINLGYDFVIDSAVENSAIDTVSYLYVVGYDISDMTGIEGFVSLQELYCSNNQLTSLNLSNNVQLIELSCGNNQLLEYIDLRNGNNQGLLYFTSMNSAVLECIDVDELSHPNIYWAKDTWTTFKLNCNSEPIGVKDYSELRKVVKVLDMLGRSVTPKPNIPLLYIYNNGTIEKKIIIKK